jgi:hypothetical protein
MNGKGMGTRLKGKGINLCGINSEKPVFIPVPFIPLPLILNPAVGFYEKREATDGHR